MAIEKEPETEKEEKKDEIFFGSACYNGIYSANSYKNKSSKQFWSYKLVGWLAPIL